MGRGYAIIDGRAAAVKAPYVLINGAAFPVNMAHVLADGAMQLWYQRGLPLTYKSVGDIVKFKVAGSYRDFIIVQQGRPGFSFSLGGKPIFSSSYDASCDGTWIMMRDIYTYRYFYEGGVVNTNYAGSGIRAWCDGDFYASIDDGIKPYIKQVKIPYTAGSGTGTMGAHVFPLSAAEVGVSYDEMESDGSRLDYFISDARRAASDKWMTRSRYTGGSGGGIYITAVTAAGKYLKAAGSDTLGVRPAMILQDTARVDDNGYIIGE